MRAWTPGRRSAHRSPQRRSLPCHCRPADPGHPPRFLWIRRLGDPACARTWWNWPRTRPAGPGRWRWACPADAGLSLDPDIDLARRAASALGTPAFAALAARTGLGERDLARQALAWRQGGPAGLESLGAGWDPAADDPDAARLLTAARAALRAKTNAAQPIIEGNRVTAGRMQLRLGRDLRWYPYARSDDDWEPSGAAEADPARALEDL